MKLKASGVIEPDFKIKEGKKKKRAESNEGDSSKVNRKEESSISVNDKTLTNKSKGKKSGKHSKFKGDNVKNSKANK